MKKVSTMILTAVCFCMLTTTVMAAKTVSVTARVVSGTGAIRAKQQPVVFTVPAGKTAVIKKYFFSCQKSKVTRKVLGKNIYCLTTKKYMVDAKNKPIMSLPPGKYKFFVGGYPGAYGILTYTLTP